MSDSYGEPWSDPWSWFGGGTRRARSRGGGHGAEADVDIRRSDLRVNYVTGEQHVIEDETDAHTIPGSTYSNASGFTHDHYSGTTALASDPHTCLGVTPAS